MFIGGGIGQNGNTNSNSGGVTDFSFTNTNGFTGVVQNSTTTPNLSIDLDNNCANIIQVSQYGGDDSTANGTIARPFSTISAANAYIKGLGDASTTKTYMINCATGEYSDINFSPLPNVILNLNQSKYEIQNVINLDETWANKEGILYIKDGILNCDKEMILDFAICNAVDPLVIFRNIGTNKTGSFQFNGGTNQYNQIYIYNAGGRPGLGLFSTFVINHFHGAFSGGEAATINLAFGAPSPVPYKFYINNLLYCYYLTVSNVSHSVVDISIFNSHFIGSQINFSSIYSDGGMNILSRASTFESVLNLNGESVNLDIDALQLIPNFTNGATFTPTVIANGMNANYTPSSYTPVDESVSGHLQGINNALENLNTLLNANKTGES